MLYNKYKLGFHKYKRMYTMCTFAQVLKGLQCVNMHYTCAWDFFKMLFHNRPVKAAMGSVIVNGGVRLSGGKSLVIPNL